MSRPDRGPFLSATAANGRLPIHLLAGCAFLLGGLESGAGIGPRHLAAAERADGPPTNADRLEPQVSVGLEGVYRTGFWTPLRVRGGNAETAWLWADDPDGSPVGAACMPARARPPRLDALDAPLVRPERVAGLVRFGRPRGRIGLSAEASAGMDSQILQSLDLPPPLAGDTPVVVVVGRLPSITRACQLLERSDGVRPVAVELPLSSLDGGPLDLDAADALIFCGTSLRADASGPPTVAATLIDTWVRRGGHLLLLAGRSAIPLEAWGTPLSEWLPGSTRPAAGGSGTGLAPLRRPVAIELFARAARPLAFPPTAPPQVPVFGETLFAAGTSEGRPVDRAFDGAILLHEGQNPTDLPLVTRRGHGLGTITWVGLDLDSAPFADWSGSESLLARLLADRFATTEQRGPFARAAAGDLSGQLRRAVDTFPETAPVPFGVVALLAIGHVAILYPVSWWIAGRLTTASRGWSEAAAWLLLPATVILFTGGSIAVDAYWMGSRPCFSGCGVVDIDVGAGQMRVTSFRGVWSPENGNCDVRAEAAPAVRALATGATAPAPLDAPERGPTFSAVVSWFADAGRSLGGADAPTAHPSLASHGYHYAPGLERLIDVPIAAASSRLFECRIDLDSGNVGRNLRPGLFEGRLDRDPQGTLRGSLVSRLPFPLEGCQLAYSGWVYTIGTLAAGGSFDPALARGPTSLSATLTRRTATGDRDLPVAYDPASRDLLRILEVAGFFAAAGGESYTGLPAGRLGRLDMSPLIEVNRAVLSGRGPAVAAWSIDGLPGGGAPTDSEPAQPGGLWRFVLPLGRPLAETAAGQAAPDRGRTLP